jgi:Toluene-4-monooxygenase system protein B (TmoB)
MPLPLYGFLEGDTIGLLILADEEDTVKSLGQKLQEAAAIRVAPVENLRIMYRDQLLDPGLTVAAAGFRRLDRFDGVRG